MKILLLADSNSSHTIKWATALAEKNFEIIIFSFTENVTDIYKKYKSIIIESAGIPRIKQFNTELHFSKVIYFSAIPAVKRIIKKYKPDILHAHYASSYGLLGALTSFHPYIISVYGSDVFSFPRKNKSASFIIKFNLSKADKILTTSNIMAKEVEKYTSKNIEVTPFGIDINKFKPMVVDKPFSNKCIVIGTIKALEKIYGIDLLLITFKNLKDKFFDVPLKLLIVGKGTQENNLKKLSNELKINKDTTFTGYVNPEDIPKYHNMIDIFVSLSIEEGFGVAVLEASACAKAVVVSNVGGLLEVVENNKTGFVVETENPDAATLAIEKLIFDEKLRRQFGINGRKRVEEFYNWNDNLNQISKIYKSILNKS